MCNIWPPGTSLMYNIWPPGTSLGEDFCSPGMTNCCTCSASLMSTFCSPGTSLASNIWYPGTSLDIKYWLSGTTLENDLCTPGIAICPPSWKRYMLLKPQLQRYLNPTIVGGWTWKWLCTPHHPPHTYSMSVISQLLLTQFWTLKIGSWDYL